MKAIINNSISEVRIIDKNYNETSVEVEILSGTFEGCRTIVSKTDLIKEKKPFKRYIVQVQDFNYNTQKWVWKNIKYCTSNEEAKKHCAEINMGARIKDRAE